MKRSTITILLGLMLTAFASVNFAQEAVVRAPNPVLVFAGAEYFKLDGRELTRYRYFVFNGADYPNTMFAPATDLPPCGSNTKSARTWVDVLDQRGKKLQAFCNFGSNKDLDSIWFAAPVDETPPSWIYIELNDRKTGTKYKSNLAETTL
jgi:hypothetical protein